MIPGTWAAASRSSLPWSVLDAQRTRLELQREHVEDIRRPALQEIEAQQARGEVERGTAPVRPDMPDSAVRMLAVERAGYCTRWLIEPRSLRELAEHVEALGARPGVFEGLEWDGAANRARCAAWWRRQLRRAVVRMHEAAAVAAGRVARVTRSPYVSHETAERVRERRESNAAVLERTELENEAGQVFTLAELAATSTANPAIRRGELMTRIAGCEASADRAGHRGVFLTATAPSRFHRYSGDGLNPRYSGATPRESQEWLCATWAKARARLARIGLRFYGFRVAEPHRDGCAHWHLMLWTEAANVDRMVSELRAWWLRDDGDEPGAREHRLKSVDMRPGGAAGYCAKYIAKNIDDAGSVGATGHVDEDAATGQQIPLWDGTAARVQAWASAWGIRQFQAIGQPPVTVWRELRRVEVDAADVRAPAVQLALAAVNRDGAKRADWSAYIEAQGGIWVGRDYRIRIATERREKAGRYETTDDARPVGVLDVSCPLTVYPSKRAEWKPRGEWGQRREAAKPHRAPWTRVNNCSRPGAPLVIWTRAIEANRGEEWTHDRAAEAQGTGGSGATRGAGASVGARLHRLRGRFAGSPAIDHQQAGARSGTAHHQRPEGEGLTHE